MKIIDPERWIFNLTSLAIAAVFILLMPSTQVIARWFPGKTDWLWFYPGVMFALSFVFWLLYRLSIPALIQKGFFEERRRNREPLQQSFTDRAWRWLRPMLRLMAQVFLVAALCCSVLTLMRSQKNRALLESIARDPLYEARARNHKWL